MFSINRRWFAAGLAAVLAIGLRPARGSAPQTVVVGTTSDSFPYSISGGDGTLEGFAVDVLDAVARQQHLDLHREIRPGLEINARFQRGEFDLLQLLTETPARQSYVEFSVPFLEDDAGVVVRANSRFNSLASLAGRRVAYITAGSPLGDMLRDRKIGAELVSAPSVRSGLELLASGKVDAVCAGRFTLNALIDRDRKTLGGLRLLNDRLTGYTLRHCFAVHRGNAALIAQINEGLAAIARTGEYARIRDHWLGAYEPAAISRQQVIEWGSVALAAALLAALVVVAHQRRLHAALTRQSAEIEAQRALLQALYDHLPTGMTLVALTPDGPRILSINREAERLYGEAADAYIREALGRRTSHGGITRYERTAPGTQRVLDVTLLPITTQPGEPPRVCLLEHDITARKQADAELAQSRKLRAVGELVGGIAHEFNNLLTPILLKVGEVQLLRPQDHMLSQDMEVVAGAARRGADLTKRLLMLGRKRDALAEPVRLDMVVENHLQLLRPTGDRRIHWEHPVAGGLPPLRFRAEDLNQIVLNLLLNARDTLQDKLAGRHATDWEPRIVVRADRLPESAATPSRAAPEGASLRGWQRLSVQDNGMGIPAEVMERVFEPFFTTKEVGRGTGLGLATVWHLATEAGGRVEVNSAPGTGTTFQVYLPDWHLETRAPEIPPAGGPARPRLRANVLLVEDDPLVGQAVLAMLRRHGGNVQLMEDGRAAAAALRANGTAYDLLVVDVNLPGMNGLELVQLARELRLSAAILVMSGRIEESVEIRSREAGADRVIGKPFAVAEFDSVVEACLARNSGPRAALRTP